MGQILCRIEGPFAFVYYEADGGRIWFGRDALGRRSLLTIRPKDEESQEGSEERMGIFLASVAPDGGGEGGEEVEAGQGVFYISISEWMRGEARVHYFPRPGKKERGDEEGGSVEKYLDGLYGIQNP